MTNSFPQSSAPASDSVYMTDRNHVGMEVAALGISEKVDHHGQINGGSGRNSRYVYGYRRSCADAVHA
jgi:hypothetical protein